MRSCRQRNSEETSILRGAYFKYLFRFQTLQTFSIMPNKHALKNVISAKIKIIIKWISVYFFIRNTLRSAALRTQFKEYSYASFASFYKSGGSQYSAKVNPYLCAQIPRLNEYIPTERLSAWPPSHIQCVSELNTIY